MYGADFLNRAHLFQRTGGWLAGVRNGDEGPLTELLQRGTYAHLNALRIETLNKAVVEEFHVARGTSPIADDRVVYWSPLTVQLTAEVSACLTNVRRIQNLVLPLAHRAAGLKGNAPPKSLADAIKTIQRVALPMEIRRRAMQYWTSSGAMVKAFRDVDLHHASVVRHTLFQLRPVETCFLTLADNPESKSPGQFRFAMNRNAIEYCGQAFRAAHDFVEGVAEDLGFGPKQIQQIVPMGIMGEGRPGVDRTLAILVGPGKATAFVHQSDGRVAIGQRAMDHR